MKQSFVCDNKFKDVRLCLEARGMKSSLDPLDCWVHWRNLQNTKFEELRKDQVVNHLQNSEALSHKGSLARLFFKDAVHFYPQSYDVRCLDHCKKLIHDFTRAVAVKALRDALHGPCDIAYVRACIQLMRDDQESVSILKENRMNCHTCISEEERAEIKGILLTANRMEHAGTVYIIKPAGGSCGDGIVCISRLCELIKAIRESQFRVVVQKYIERPLLVRGRKFDIRQFVLITDTNPLTVYGFSRCYARFASEPWSLQSLDNRFAHLCNFSVQKNAPTSTNIIDSHSSNGHWPAFEGNMWTCEDLANYIDFNFDHSFDDFVRPQIRRIATDVATMAAYRAGLRKRSYGFEWLGLDIMLDDDLSAWLLEANVSPDVSHSTQVTSKLVPAATADALSLLLDHGAAFSSENPRRNIDHLPHPRWELWHQADVSLSPLADTPATSTSLSVFLQYAKDSSPLTEINAFWEDLGSRLLSVENDPDNAHNSFEDSEDEL